MIDRNPLQKERRKLYGMAGEYRLPAHGIEYRTLSNFWLRSPVLADFVAQMAGMCVGILHTSLMNGGQDLESDLMGRVSIPNLVLAIQYNDVGMAMGVWKGIRQFIMDHFPADGPICASTMPKFDKFLEKDVMEWFPNDPMVEWGKYVKPVPVWRPFLESISL